MGKVHDEIDDRLREWIAKQALFFVGTAPSGEGGHVNVSPKGPIETLRVLGPREVAYLDFVGSGAETIAHLRENRRIVVMLCAFAGPPRIVRLHGRGEVLLPEQPAYAALEAACGFTTDIDRAAHRAIIRVEVERIAHSCGYGVPLMEHLGEREHQPKSVAKRLRVEGPDAYLAYQDEKNATSIDGLPAVPARR
jgi:hypothetical protein